MAKADLIALSQVLAADAGDELQLGYFHDEALLTLADTEVTLEAHIIPVTANEGSYAWPANTMRILTAFFGNYELQRTHLHHLDNFDRDWSVASGTPRAYIESHEPERTVRLYPRPSATSATWIPISGQPFGVDYPSDRLILLTAEWRDGPPWLDFPLVLSMLTREFGRESSHRDATMVKTCTRLGQTLRKIGGLP